MKSHECCSDSSEVDAASDLTLGNVICGLPSRALKNRKKVGRSKEEEMERDKQRILKEVRDYNYTNRL